MTELNHFVRSALEAGKSQQEIREVLLQAKWQEKEISEALSLYADIPFPVPVPYRQHSGWAKESILYLVTFFMLYVATISLGNLLSGFVDTKFPDLVQDQDNYLGENYQHDAIRWLLASLIVSFPTWLWLTRKLLISYVDDPQRRMSPVRAWLTYLTLFFAATCILTTLVVLVAGALSGELAVRTILKCIVVIVLTGGIFGFYFWDLHRGENAPASANGRRSPMLTLAGWLVCVVTLGTIVGAIATVGSPINARKERADEKRASDLNEITYAVRTYYANHKVLPADQDKAFGSVGNTTNSYQDPETKARYEYRVIDKQHFEMGATFQTDTSKVNLGRNGYGQSYGNVFGKHRAGLEKFTLDAKGPGS